MLATLHIGFQLSRTVIEIQTASWKVTWMKITHRKAQLGINSESSVWSTHQNTRLFIWETRQKRKWIHTGLWGNSEGNWKGSVKKHKFLSKTYFDLSMKNASKVRSIRRAKDDWTSKNWIMDILHTIMPFENISHIWLCSDKGRRTSFNQLIFSSQSFLHQSDRFEELSYRCNSVHHTELFWVTKSPNKYKISEGCLDCLIVLLVPPLSFTRHNGQRYPCYIPSQTRIQYQIKQNQSVWKNDQPFF